MNIKEREQESLFNYLKRALKILKRGLFNKKSKLFFSIIILIIVFIVGLLLGLLITGFFGSLSSPSQLTLDVLHYVGIHNLQQLKGQMDNILKENIRIPFNYIRGQFSNPDKIYIDISFTDFQRLEYKRQQALEKGILLTSGEDYVPGKIRYKDKEIDVRLRLKGDNIDHLKGDKWSFRIKVRGNDNLFGMKTFSIQTPETRNNLNEFIYQKALKKEGVLGVRYEFIEVVVNGDNKGIYAIEEHFEKQLIESNNRREGILLKFNEDLKWEWDATEQTSDFSIYNDFGNNDIDFFYKSTIETFDNDRALEDPVLSQQFEKARSLLELFRQGQLPANQVFDTDKMATYFAINAIMKCEHASLWMNIRFYYNPVTSKIEPIGFDGTCNDREPILLEEYFPDGFYDGEIGEVNKIWWELIFKDRVFFEKYIKELERVSQKSYLDDLFSELDSEIKKNKNIIHKDYPSYHFSKNVFYANQEQVRFRLNPLKSINVYFEESIPNQNKIILSIGNIDFPLLEIENVVYDGVVFEPVNSKLILPKKDSGDIKYNNFEFKTNSNFHFNTGFEKDLKVNYKIYGLDNIMNEEVLPWPTVKKDFVEKDFIRQEPGIGLNEISTTDEGSKIIKIKKGTWKLTESITIPEGYDVFCEAGTRIDLKNSAMILSYSSLQFIGEKSNPIWIFSSDKTGQGITVLNTNKKSNLKNVIFENLKNPDKEGWQLTGAVSFNEADFKFDNVIFKNIIAEDNLNAINSEFEIKNSEFENCYSDCFDDDFSNGLLEDSIFINCGNDCIDFSGAEVTVNNVEIDNTNDKAISIGEKSNVNLNNIIINGEDSYIAIASKDKSSVFVNSSQISGFKYGFAVYQKKPEFGSALMNVVNTQTSDLEKESIVESGSKLFIDDKIVLGSQKDVYGKLYAEE